MSEIENLGVSSAGVEAGRAPLDWAIAGCICAVAVSFWLWDGKAAPTPVATPPSLPAAAVSPPANASSLLNNAGTQLYLRSDFAGAEALFRRAIEADPGGALGYSNLGAALIGEHRYDEAIAALQKAVTLDPSFAQGRNNLNWALDEKRKHRN
jgi:tetratricopeptide (TPR) repeat protein